MKRVLLIIWLSSFLAATHAATTDKTPSDELRDYANQRLIDTTAASATSAANATQGMYRLALPLDVYRGLAHADLRDIRVFNAKGERVPFAIVNDTVSPAEVMTTRVVTPLPFFPVTEDATQTSGNTSLTVKLQSDGTLISLNTAPPNATTTMGDNNKTRRVTGYLVDASRLNVPINAINLDWEKNVNAQTGRVTIEGSNDLNTWRTIAVNQPLVDMAFNGAELIQKKIEFTPSSDKYLRLTWASSTASAASANFAITKLDAESVTKQAERPAELYKVVGVAAGQGTYEFTLDARLPITRARLLLPDANTLAPTLLSIQSSAAERGADGKLKDTFYWQQVANATFYRLTRDGVELISPATTLMNTNTAGATTAGATKWQAKIDARSGGIGSGMPTLEVTWTPQQIVFTARGEAPFTLAFGRADAKPTQFQISDLMPGYRQAAENQLPLAKLTAAENQAVVAASAATSTNATDWKKIILWAVLIIGVALMAWMAIRLGRDTHKPNAE
jgi:hypothetical protein